MRNFSLHKIKLLGVVIILILTISCKKLIEIPPSPPQDIAAQDVFVDSTSVIGAIAGVYNNFNESTQVLSVNNGLITASTGLSGDELLTTTGEPAFSQLSNNAILPSNSNMETLWSSSYLSLYPVNDCLTRIASSTGISESLKQQLTGELKTVRALYYFNLVNLFGGVPIVTSTVYKTTSLLPRASVVDVYNQIIDDLTDARKRLNGNYPSDGHIRPNIYVASALLAKVYLYQSQWQNAVDMASQVINSGDYRLTDSLNSVFLDRSSEAIWQLPAENPNQGVVEAATFLPSDAFTISPFPLTATLLNSFEPGDQRKIKWVGTQILSDNNGNNVSYYYPFKYKNRNQAQPAEDYMILRLGEQYLIRAEALAHLSNITEALQDVNMVRHRAGLLPYAGAMDQASVLAAIMHERQTELFCEWGNRWFDLQRTGTINSVLNGEKTGWKSTTDPLYPIPLTEKQSNPNLTQNPGY
ncbi:RagB/SusD family nutrient uptake outer membrane protein [Mucilaginibacter sp. L196]|uniref:RagB/SusD family nutrient uptake outer membrane protein n=1 Tax=Mucilaginibacter sp. L196 TaxID=1641870 RepID=UPI00131C18D4|nr:RagB/SusD family nutrient uptake outer membrane protein [Mucilaginibacter sp. L196]